MYSEVWPGTFPFGKHKGKLLEEVARDRRYCKWLLKQSWFKEEHAVLAECLDEIMDLHAFLASARISY